VPPDRWGKNPDHWGGDCRGFEAWAELSRWRLLLHDLEDFYTSVLVRSAVHNIEAEQDDPWTIGTSSRAPGNAGSRTDSGRSTIVLL
jgi:hypothetical protein